MLSSYVIPCTVPSVVPYLFLVLNSVSNRQQLIVGNILSGLSMFLTELIKSVKCHTLPSLRRDMDDKFVGHYLFLSLIVGGDYYRGSNER
jgi:hypothetical protein